MNIFKIKPRYNLMPLHSGNNQSASFTKVLINNMPRDLLYRSGKEGKEEEGCCQYIILVDYNLCVTVTLLINISFYMV